MNRILRNRSRRGQGLVEFALILPIFMILLVAVFDLGHVVWANDALANSAREAARFAIVHGGSDSTPCPVGPLTPLRTAPAASTSCPYPSPSRQSIKDVAIDRAMGSGGALTVYVCYGNVTTCVSDTDEPGATNARGTAVTVNVQAQVSLAVPSFFSIGSFSLSSSSTMLVNH
jgi:hypothetical protein